MASREPFQIRETGERRNYVRGRLLKELISDRPQDWPKFSRLEIFGRGREFRLRSNTSGALIVDENVTELIAVGDRIDVENAGDAANGRYTIAAGATYNSGTRRTTIPVVETVGLAVINDTYPFRSRASISAVRWPAYISGDIQTMNVASGNITLLDSTLGDDDHICDCDMFLLGHRVRITGSAGGVNDRVWICRADYTVASALRTVKLDVTDIPLEAITSGSLGTATLILPTPRRVIGYGLAYLSCQRLTIPAGAIVSAYHDASSEGYYEIITPDAGPSDAGDPETP
jgi:hypothetical protein